MTTKREDALSIVGEDAPEEVLQAIEDLDEKQRTEKSQADDLVIKADEEPEEDSPYTIEQDIILRAMLEKAGVDKAELEEKAWDYAYKKALPDTAYAWVEHGEGCAKVDGKTPQKCRHLPYKDEGGKVECGHVRAALSAIGGARQQKPMEGVPSSAKQKLRSALKGCQGEKAEVLEVELTEYVSGRIDGFNAALDLDVTEHTEVQPIMTEEVVKEEAKASINLDAILEAVKPKEPEKPVEEQKAEIPPDELDSHLVLLRQVLAAEGEGRARKLEGAEAVLRSLAIHVSKTIDETTPPSPEDVANTMKSQVEEALRPMMDKIAVLETAVLGTRSEAPKSKALSFDIPPTSTILAAKGATGATGEVSSITKLVNRSCGLPDDFKRGVPIL